MEKGFPSLLTPMNHTSKEFGEALKKAGIEMETGIEKWLPVVDAKDYFVSDAGRLFSFKNYHGKPYGLKRPITHPAGYKLSRMVVSKGVTKTNKMHRVVAEAFIPNPEKYGFVNHKNGIKGDNRAENLEWCTKSMNQYHAYKMGLKVRMNGELHPLHKLTNEDVFEIRNLIAKGVRNKVIAKQFEVRPDIVCKIKTRRTWTHI